MNFRLLRRSLLGLSIGIGLVGLGAYYIKNQAIHFNQDSATRLPDLGGPFTLVDQFGKTRTEQDFRGKYMLVYFGYTFCPDVCPLGLRHISGALEELGRDLDQVVPIFITIDPERDTVESLHSYASTIHSSFVMLTGTHRDLDPVLKSYNVYAVKAKPDGTMADYLMDHSSLIYLMDRNGALVDFFPHTAPPKEIADKIHKHLIQEIQKA
ncbi:MAG: SCO family protein [Candidatus Paracaedibacteraceae bacterium]|nr:SCO family protein [Candidatus Paracaedibacteraceae bacterium]